MKIKLFITCFFILSITAIGQTNDFNNRLMLGEGYEQAGQYEKAKSIYEELFKNSPDNYQVFNSLNNVYLLLKEYDNSVKITTEMVNSHPHDINLYGMLGKTYYLMGNEEKAYEVWENALSRFSDKEMSFRVIANYAIERRDFEKAVEYLKRGKNIAKESLYFSYDLANIYSLTMQYKEAAEEYCSILDKNPKQLRTVESRILSYINKPGALSATIEVIEECSINDNLPRYYLLSQLYITEKSYEKAYEIYLKIDEQKNNQGVDLYNFANIIMTENAFSVASETFNKIIEKYPESPVFSSSQLGYAKTKEAELINEFLSEDTNWKPYYKNQNVSSDKLEEVVNSYEKIADTYRNSEIGNEALFRIGLIKLNLENSHSEAENYFNRIINESPASQFAVKAYGQLGSIALINGDLEKSENYFNKLIQTENQNQEIKNQAEYKLAKINFYKENIDSARSILSKIMANLKDNSANDAIELAFILNPSFNDSINIINFAKAEFLAEQKNFSEASEIYEKISQDQRSMLIGKLALLRQAQMAAALDEYETSINILGRIAGEKEKNIYSDKALFLLGKIYQFGLNDPSKALEVYNNLLAKFPNSLYLDDAREEIIKLRNKLS